MKNTILFGDCRDTLPTIDTKARMCVTSPPYYGLRNYGGEENQIGQEDTPEQFIDNLVSVFRSVRDVLTDDGTLWVNIGDSYYNYRPGKGQALVKQSVSKTKQDLPDTCARRGNKLEGLKEKDLIGIPWMLAFALRADGWYLRQDIIWHKPNPMPESVKTDVLNHMSTYSYYLKTKSIIMTMKQLKSQSSKTGEQGTAMRVSITILALAFQPHSGLTKSYERKNKRDVWTITNKPYKGAHFAVFPPDLIEPCILAGSQEGDIILDPFMGSGTTAMVAKKHRRSYIGCELHEDYASLQTDRIDSIPPQLVL